MVGNSHLRSVVDGFVPMPEGCLSFGFSATPGGSARDILKELKKDKVPRGGCFSNNSFIILLCNYIYDV